MKRKRMNTLESFMICIGILGVPRGGIDHNHGISKRKMRMEATMRMISLMKMISRCSQAALHHPGPEQPLLLDEVPLGDLTSGKYESKSTHLRILAT
jgi:hypothetical protein